MLYFPLIRTSDNNVDLYRQVRIKLGKLDQQTRGDNNSNQASVEIGCHNICVTMKISSISWLSLLYQKESLLMKGKPIFFY